MMLVIANWLGVSPRIVAARERPGQPRPMKIGVERLPDYQWQQLGFQQPKDPETDPWFRS